MLGLKQALEKDIAMQEKLIARDEQQVLLLPSGKLKLGNSGKTLSLLDESKNYKATDDKNEFVIAIKKKCFFLSRLSIMKSNIIREKKFLSQYYAYDMFSVNEMIPKAYRINFDIFSPSVNTASSFHNDSLKHQTADGSLRRSKSELLISMLYDEYGVSYEYESVLSWPTGNMSDHAEMLKEILGLPDSIRPDFKLTEPSGRTIYHEHCGMFDNPEYLDNFMKKLAFYHSLGYTLGDNLIVTADSKDGTLNQTRIVELIETRLKNRGI